MTPKHTDSRDTGDAAGTRNPRGRRAFLAGAGASLAALAGCTFNVNVGGGGSTSEPQTATRTPTPTRTATRTPTPTATESPTPTATATPEPDPELEVITVQPEPIAVELVTPAPELRYRVERFYLYIDEASDAVFNGPNTEEIYGEITISATARGTSVSTTKDRKRVWSANEGSAKEIAEDDGLVLETEFAPVEFVFPNLSAAERANAYIEITGTFREADNGGNVDDVFSGFRDNTRWHLTEPTVESGFSDSSGQSRFVIPFSSDGNTLMNLSYNVVEV
ncbi:hypothetical protein [Haloarcula marina]|uniref:hypothetical protein n=1 Tax=Haloarcula marina TaxID=2961574 RepID=UPI0020B70899|nr:hypothetical protein [Halomicroarcula marina]